MKPVGHAIHQALRAASTPPAQQAPRAKAPFANYKSDLKKAGDKFLARQGGTSPPGRVAASRLPAIVAINIVDVKE
ncbi:hypothetical protein [Pseudoduganella namucuonensis]|uniref:Uncharacterized protein n=1 Tax=Pseudoduganella namucuonensis TaxID=1035707 RepID=A0A1I7M6E8_9BURK|nr:hypothetical protein [Pseudoduganella namucuonensis]SFV17514.1 hypothetical protein SAMN05216552_10665 [Pseudoduganella namucuonensis]